MAYEFRLPDIGEGLTEAEIVEWRVAVGDTVAMDQVVVDVETDKAVVEIPIPVAGTVLYLAEDQVVEVGAVLVVIGEEGEVWPAEPEPKVYSGDAAPIVGTLDTEVTTLFSSREAPVSSRQSPLALPVVRKLAKEMGVDLSTVRGTGPQGRVTRDDVIAVAGEATTEVDVPGPPGREGRPLSRIRRAVADHMTRSWTEIPHVTAFAEVDATRLLEVKKALTERSGVTVSIDALVAKALIPALRVHPDFNARLEGDTVIDNERFDIGLAVDTPDGLMVVTVRDVASKSLTEVSTEIASLAAAAKDRRATPDQRQTFTVSNIGALGGGYGTPIVPYGTTAILSVGRAVDKPVVRDGTVVIAPMMPLSLAYDHRLIDGGEGRRFLALVIENLAEPALFLAD
jgi:pyruvate dehydrogenase E2 component (dihydrolipoamide acetyltransferase)